MFGRYRPFVVPLVLDLVGLLCLWYRVWFGFLMCLALLVVLLLVANKG